MLLGKLFSLVADQFVILETAVQERRAKGLSPHFFSLFDDLTQAHVIAETAAAVLVEYDLAQIFTQTILAVVFHRQVYPGS